MLVCFRVDYVDAFGRSRRCLRKDLPELERMDRKLQQSDRCVGAHAWARMRALVQVRASDEVLATYMYMYMYLHVSDAAPNVT